MDFAFARSRYDHELQRKEQLTTAMTLLVAVLTALGGGIVAMARSFSYDHAVLTMFFVSSVLVAAMVFIAGLTYLAGASHREQYLHLPPLKMVAEWEDEYRNFVTSAVQTAPAKSVEDRLLERIVEAADHNTTINDARSELLSNARAALFMLVLGTALSAMLYVLD